MRERGREDGRGVSGGWRGERGDERGWRDGGSSSFALGSKK